MLFVVSAYDLRPMTYALELLLARKRKIEGPPGGVLFITEQRRNVAYDHQRGSYAAPGSTTRANRSTPLPYVTMHTAGDISPEGVLYRNRRQALKARPQGPAKLCVYDEMVLTYGGDRIAPLRGFVINYRYDTATAGEIAVEIGLSVGLVADALWDMLDIGLLCWCKRPGTEIAKPKQFTFLEALNNDSIGLSPNTTLAFGVEVIEWNAADEAARAREAEARKPKGKTEALANADDTRDDSTPREATDRETDGANAPPEGTPLSGAPPAPCRHGAGTAPVKGGLTPNTKTQNGLNGQTPNTPGLAVSTLGVGETVEGNLSASFGGRTAETATTAETPQTPDTQPPATTTHAVEPAEAELPTEADSPEAARPLGAMQWHAEAFATQVVDRLYPTRDDLVSQGLRCKGGPRDADTFRRTELACFARSFEAMLSNVDQTGAMRLLTWSLAEAQRMFRVRCRHTRGQLLRYIFGSKSASMAASRKGTTHE